ncbi:hypothetical protein BS17DRAFT_475970 [Gyrodon lividus]|nr:hypothetical protein BS17DRAFT_475970 [Gyrodon lividus]
MFYFQRKPQSNWIVPFILSRDSVNEAHIEGRVLEVSCTVRKQPVQYLWSIHGFVKDLIGALQITTLSSHAIQTKREGTSWT